MKNILYYLGLSALITHELDAVLNFEWRLLYHLRTLPDGTASSIFVAMHLPIFFLFLYFSHHHNAKVKIRFQVAVAFFFVIHGALHFRLSDHELYAFTGFFSHFYIYSAVAFGLLFMGLVWKDKRMQETK